MKLKDKYTIYIKNQKPISLLKTSLLVIGTTVALLLVNFYVENIKKNDYEYTPVMENASYKATFVGDIMLGRSIQQIDKNYGYNSLFKNVSYIWKNSDTVVCNLENVVIDNEKDYSKKHKTDSFYAKSNSVNALKDNGFNLISLANNHTSDYGDKGLKNTINVLKENGLEYVGAGENIEEASKYNIKEINGIKVAIISISDKIMKNTTATTDDEGVFTTAYSEYPLIVSKAKTEADIVIVYTHWGKKYTNNIVNEQEELAHNLINSGADIVIGTHQHTLQSIEKYNNGIILYGIGNFIFDQGWDFTKESTLVNFMIDENGNFALECLPIFIEGATPEVTTNAYHTGRIFKILTQKLDSNDYKIQDNKLIIEGKTQLKNNNKEV